MLVARRSAPVSDLQSSSSRKGWDVLQRRRQTPTVTGTISVRMLWPFMRVMRDFGPEMKAVEAAGLDPATLGDHTERVQRTVAREVIRAPLERTGDVALGARAVERTEPADFGVTGQAVRACSNVRQAMF